MSTPQRPEEPAPDPARIDDAVLALLWLTATTEKGDPLTWAWKGHDWEALNRLHEKGFITDPVGKFKRVHFTAEGLERSEALFKKLFVNEKGAGNDHKVRHPFAPSAQPLWASVSPEAKVRILDSVWCGHCGGSRRIEDYTGLADERGDLILRGFCAECGHVVVRILETSETLPHLAPLPIFSLSQRLSTLSAPEFTGLNCLLDQRFGGAALTQTRAQFRLHLRETQKRPAGSWVLRRSATFGDLLRLAEEKVNGDA